MSNLETNRQADANALDNLERLRVQGTIGVVIQTRPGVYEYVQRGFTKRSVLTLLAPYPQPENNGAKR